MSAHPFDLETGLAGAGDLLRLRLSPRRPDAARIVHRHVARYDADPDIDLELRLIGDADVWHRPHVRRSRPL